MQEKYIEKKLVEAVKAIGGICPKFVSPGMNGMPDRLVLLPRMKMGFVELKSPGEVPRPIQLKRHKVLRKLGFKVYVIDNPKQIGGVLHDIQT